MDVRFEGKNGHVADVTRCLLMTHIGPHSGSRRSNAQECLGYYELVSPQLVAVLGHIREHKVQIGSARHEGLGRFAPLLNTALLGVLELGASL